MVDPAYPSRARSLDDLLAMLVAGSDSTEQESDGRMTALDHHLQCAAVLRDRFPDDKELQVAGLIHDIGHRLAPGRPEEHGVLGGAYVRDLLGERVGDLVELHVDAKRYLVHAEPGYREELSEESKRTLIAQGEAMDDAQAAAFIAHPQAADAIALRRADEAAKVPGRVVDGVAAWWPLVEEVAAR